MGKSDLRVIIGADASNFNKNIKAAQGQLIKFENVAKSVGSSIKTALVGAFAIDSAQRFFSTMIDAGRGFEDQMARVKAISNASAKNFEMMRKEAARLGSTTKYSASQAAAALENLVRNGLSATKATKALSSVLELAGANAIELAEAADIVTNTMNMFEISIDDLNRVNDVLSSTTAKSATNLTDLYEALKYSAPTANLFGIQIEEVNAALGVLANQGIKGSQAGTTLRNVLNSLVKPSKQAADILANLGIDEVSIKMDGLLGTLEKLKGLNIEDFVRIFGKEFGGITKALVDRGDLTAALKKELDNSMGEAARMFEQGSGNFNKALDNFSSTFEGAMIKMFDAIKPALTGTINWFTNLINVFQDGKAMGAGAITALVGGLSVYINTVRKAVKEENLLTKAHNEHISEVQDLVDLIKKNTILSAENSDVLRIQDIRYLQTALKDVELDEFKELKDVVDRINLDKLNNEFDKFKDLYEEAFGQKLELPVSARTIVTSIDEISAKVFDLERNIKNYKNQLKKDPHNDFLKESINDASDEIRRLKSIQNEIRQLDIKAVDSFGQAIDKVNNKLQGATFKKSATVAGSMFDTIAKKAKSCATTIASFFGGWATIGITALSAAVTAIYHQWNKLNEAVRESKRIQKEAQSANEKLDISFKNIVNELAKAEKGSIAWSSRLAILKRDYPDLVDELRLSEVHLNSTSSAFLNLANAMDEVLSRQKELNLAEAAGAARDRLNKAYFDNDYGWFGGNTEFSKRQKAVLERTNDDFKENVKLGFWEIAQVLSQQLQGTSEEVRAKKLAEIHNILKTKVVPQGLGWGVDDPRTKQYADKVSLDIYNDYMKRAGNAIANLPNINGSTFKTNVSDDLSKYVYKALQRLNEHTANTMKDAPFKATEGEDKYITEETQRFASQLIDEIINKFKNVKIDGKDFREILKMDANFAEIMDVARTKWEEVEKSTGAGTGGSGSGAKSMNEELLEAEDEYAATMQMLADLCEKDLIETEEFDSRHLAALGKLISVYERWWKDLDEAQENVYHEWVRYYKELKAESPVDDGSLAKQIAQDKGNYKNSLNEILGRKSGIDIFSDNMQFQEGRLEHLRGQLEDLKALREEYLGKGFDNEIKSLDGAIITLTQHVEELDKAFTAERLKEFKKELSDLTWDVGTASYDTFVGLGEAFISVNNAMDTLSNLDEYKTEWERFVAGFQAFISITDTMLNTALGIKELAEMFKELRKQKELFNAIESGSKVADIAGIEGEAAAVVAAEATKSAAIETAAVANIAAKLAQAKAAQILMAAESTAAYAGIPFAGVGLAAAQIAEMEALIAAAASLPAFANGGIVGGNSYIGDKVLARVNSGEMILNQKQQKNLFSMLNNGSVNGGGQVKFKIEGKELVGVLKNYNNIKGKVQ